MLFKSTLLLPALLALGLATAVPGPEVEEDLAARGQEFGDDIAARGTFGEEDLAARGGSPDCGQYASWSSKQHRCFCHQSGYTYYSDGKYCCQSNYQYDHNSHRCCRKQNYDFKHGRCY